MTTTGREVAEWAAPVGEGAPAPAAGRSGFVSGAAVGLALLAGFGLGRVTGTGGAQPAPAPSAGYVQYMAGSPAPGGATAAHVHAGSGAAAVTGPAVGGFARTASGLTLAPRATTFAAGRRQAFAFRITAAGGAPVTTYTPVHDKLLHLAVIRRDLTGYRHVHPVMAPDGTWSIDLTLAGPGSYRAVADFTAILGGQQIAAVLGTDLTVPGAYRPVALPAPATTATVDGFTARFTGTPRTDTTQPLLMSVTGPDGKPAALEPYLGAYGHLVVFREGDLGYVHVHPEPQPVAGAVKFWLAAPGPGRYRMFFDFQVAGRVRTAAFTAAVA
ncbi:hypothetical protein Asp14428_10630 [Actinoplanes sp. NBRC 14428]|uniref:Secreted protein n=1 Tax=Pseudosporangium ferrugineum TaxID=439699 RepID=A0A2T0SFI3_9ACTN|nr:hypothetical protein [Pseudosporangium ferrugineum]PRY32169.1 hypothetical protein CLV70_102380 [Pseudosporangium ferrugineum]BCJ49588.1 hypothetical protein Asp14428_10630 [Actinoplanes sp. NBRC 14428]